MPGAVAHAARPPPTPPRQAVRRRAVVLAPVPLGLGCCAPAPARAGAQLLSERVEKVADLDRQVLVAARPKRTKYPAWMEGTWRVSSTFAGYAFPNKDIFEPKKLVADRSVPGFTKASIAWLGDVGKDASFDVRFVRDESGNVFEDRAFNITSSLQAHLATDDAPVVEGVEYDGAGNANRCTIRLRSGTVSSVERLELFTNARESELRASDSTFFASETVRQVNLGYSAAGYGRSAVSNYDYTTVWTYTRDLADPDRLVGSINTVGFLQANDAERFTARVGSRVPRAGGLLDASTRPCVAYAHRLVLARP